MEAQAERTIGRLCPMYRAKSLATPPAAIHIALDFPVQENRMFHSRPIALYWITSSFLYS